MSYIKTIHQIWYDFGNSKDVPDKYKEYQESWKKYHPDWEYILWNEEMGDSLMKEHYNQYYESYKNIKYPVMKTDILRYCILEQHGGMYADIDYKCLNNFDTYLKENNQYEIHINETPNKMLEVFSNHKTTSNSLLISTKKNHQFWKTIIDECFKRIKTQYDVYYIYYVVKTTGPGLINDMISEIKTKDDKLYQKINILPLSQFNFCNDCKKCTPSKTENLYAVHDYVSYWNSDLWLNIRKLFSCASLENICSLLVTLICAIYFLFTKYF